MTSAQDYAVLGAFARFEELHQLDAGDDAPTTS